MALDGAYFAAMLSASGVGIPSAERLTKAAGGAREAWSADAGTIKECLGEKAAPALLALRAEKPSLPEEIAEACEKQNIRVLVRDDEAYPPILREIARPPRCSRGGIRFPRRSELRLSALGPRPSTGSALRRKSR